MTEVATALAASDVGIGVGGSSALTLGWGSILRRSPSSQQCDLINDVFHLVGQASRRTDRRCRRLLVLSNRQSRAGHRVFGL